MPKYEVTLEWMARGSIVIEDAFDEDEAEQIAIDNITWDAFEPRGQEPDEVLHVQEIKDGEGS